MRFSAVAISGDGRPGEVWGGMGGMRRPWMAAHGQGCPGMVLDLVVWPGVAWKGPRRRVDVRGGMWRARMASGGVEFLGVVWAGQAWTGMNRDKQGRPGAVMDDLRWSRVAWDGHWWSGRAWGGLRWRLGWPGASWGGLRWP